MQTAVALGTFDGLHTGHRAVLRQVLPYAESVAVTFDMPPKMRESAAALLMLPADKLRALRQFGIRQVHPLDFSAVCGLSPEQFLTRLTEQYRPAAIACGFNYRFGKDAAGDLDFLKKYTAAAGIRLLCVPAVVQDGRPISSTAIRQWLADGNTEAANRQIFGGFQFTAPVLHGDARGRTLCFPTINQAYPAALAPLKHGVYAAEVRFGNRTLQGVCNIGIRPTFQTAQVFAETFLFDFSEEIYGKEITLLPRRFLRSERKFSDTLSLKAAIRQDVLSARAYFEAINKKERA